MNFKNSDFLNLTLMRNVREVILPYLFFRLSRKIGFSTRPNGLLRFHRA